jgi:hypothetical protein
LRSEEAGFESRAAFLRPEFLMPNAARRISSHLAFAAVIAWSSVVGAAPEPTKGPHSAAPAGPSSTGPAAGAKSNQEGNAFDSETSVDVRVGERESKKRIWSIAAGMEGHAAFVQTEPDDGRTRGDKLYAFYFVTPQVFVTKYDQLRADFGMYEHSVADPGESGFRLADISAAYTRYIPIGTEEGISPSTVPSEGVLLRLALSATAPTSYASKLHGIITVPRLRAYIERAFLDHSLFLTLNGFGEYYIDKYRSAAGGSPNALSRYAVQVTADYFIPFHKRLSIGALAGSSWTYYYGQEGVSSTMYGTVGDPQFDSQPSQQIYSAEVNAVYSFPAVKDIRSSLALTYAVGDNTVLHDGVQHIYFGFYRRSTELYATLTARY